LFDVQWLLIGLGEWIINVQYARQHYENLAIFTQWFSIRWLLLDVHFLASSTIDFLYRWYIYFSGTQRALYYFQLV
jgi:hypothetical protein